MWKELLKPYEEKLSDMAICPPAGADAIAQAEKALQVAFPLELRALLQELDGDHFLLLNVDGIVRTNQLLRAETEDDFFDLDHYLFFAENGIGDYYGYRIADGKAVAGEIVCWLHELGMTKRVACGLRDLIEKYYNDEL